jgi:glycosyltransferase involved in cell wall biosynthesis
MSPDDARLTIHMNSQVSASIIIPAHDEEASVGDVVRSIHGLELEGPEILVIDDGSSDATARAAREAGARVIRHPYNIGNGAAVKTGIRSAHGRVLVFLDADGQHDPDDIPRLLAHIPDYHMVVGARRRGSKAALHRALANRVYNRLATYVTKIRIEDLTSGLRAMRRIDALRFCDMLPNGFSYPATSTLAFLRSGRSVKYVPIRTRERTGKSKIKLLRDGPGFMMIIVKIATLFAPFRVFLPVCIALLGLGLLWYGVTYVSEKCFTNMSALLFSTSVIVFMLGLVAEQIAALRFERGDTLFDTEEADLYDDFRSYAQRREDNPPPEQR